jgi:hypothetical protein
VSPAELDSAVTALLQRTRAAQNLPEKVTDPAVLARVAALLDRVRVTAPGVESEGSAKTVSARQGRGGRHGPV